jgi:hypothetical protein
MKHDTKAPWSRKSTKIKTFGDVLEFEMWSCGINQSGHGTIFIKTFFSKSTLSCSFGLLRSFLASNRLHNLRGKNNSIHATMEGILNKISEINFL